MERSTTTLTSADTLTSTGEGLPPVDIESLPSMEEIIGRALDVPQLERLTHITNLGWDFGKALLSQQAIDSRLKTASFYKEEELEGVTIIFNPGLFGLKGSDFLAYLNRFNPAAQRFFEGTYKEPKKYFTLRGAKYMESWPPNGVQTGNYFESTKELDNMVGEALYDSDLVLMVGHSYGGLLGHDYAARHTDQARRMVFVSGGAPYLPTNINYFVARTFFALNGTRDLGRLRETIKFMSSREARDVKFVNIVDEHDPIIGGVHAPGEVKKTNSGHSGMFHDWENLEFIGKVAQDNLLQFRNKSKFDQMMVTTLPQFIAA